MGVDAEMVVAAPQWLDNEALLRLSYETAAAFGPDRFFIDRERKYDGSHALVRGTDYRLCPAVVAETTFRVALWSSFYGPGYERGDLPFLLTLARWFRDRLPGCTVYYDGDTGDSLDELTPEREAELWEHFLAHQHFPYIGGRGGGSVFSHESNPTTPHCSTCDEDMLRNGWGASYAGYWCPGCGGKTETRDGGRTWKDASDGN